MKYKVLILSLLLAFFIIGCEKDKKLQYGEVAPNASLLNLKDDVVKLHDFKGKLVVLRFWQKGCPACLEEMPQLDTFYNTHKKDIVVIGIDMGDKKPYVSGFKRDHSISFPMLLDGLLIATKKYGVIVSPTSFIIDKNGILREKLIGEMNINKFQKKVLSYL